MIFFRQQISNTVTLLRSS